MEQAEGDRSDVDGEGGPLETEVHLFIDDGAMIASRHRGLEKKRVAGSIFILLVALGWEP